MSLKIKLPFNYNNLIINLVVPGYHESENLEKSEWLKDSYKEIEEEYESLPNQKDCSIYIFSIRPKNWDKKKPLKNIARKLLNGRFINIPGFENLDFYTSENIIALLDEVIRVEKKPYPFTNKVLVTYGHSSGYYFFGDIDPDKQKLDMDLEYSKKERLLGPIKMMIDQYVTKNRLEKVQKRSPLIYNETPCISANTLARGISKSVINKFDAIILGGCNMQNIDVLSTLQKCCNFLIASQTLLPVNAYRFNTFISNTTKINYKHCKRIILESNQDLVAGDTGISVVRTEYLGTLIKSISKINLYLTANFSRLKKSIVKTRDATIYIDGGNDIYSIDLFGFYKNIFQNFKKWPDDIKDEFRKVLDELKDLVVYTQNSHTDSGLSGMCIYFPKTKYEYRSGRKINNIIYGPSKLWTNSYFSENSNWGELLKLLY